MTTKEEHLETLDKNDLFEAAPSNAVVAGHCLMFKGEALTYVGPIVGAPQARGHTIYLNPVDHEKLAAFVKKIQN